MAKRKSPVRWCGGKTRALKWLLPLLPEYTEYREAFCGGASVFFQQPVDKIRWINDKNFQLVNFYATLRDDYDNFLAECRKIPILTAPAGHTAPYKAIRGQVVLDEIARVGVHNGPKYYDAILPEDNLIRWYYQNRTSYCGFTDHNIWFAHPEGWRITLPGQLDEFHEKLQGTTITCGDYATILSSKGEDVFVYCDPPYLIQKQDLYKHSNIDHHLLAEHCKNSKHKIAISYNDCDVIRKLYSGWNLHTHEWFYSCDTNQKGMRQKKGAELLICNY